MQSIVMRAALESVARRQATSRRKAPPPVHAEANPELTTRPEPPQAPLWTWFIENPRRAGKR